MIRRGLRRLARATTTSPDTTATVVPRLIPVLAPWVPENGPLLSLGMLTAATRHWNGGSLTGRFQIQPPRSMDDVRDDPTWREGPALLLCSDYVWNSDRNLAFARHAKSINPELLVVHGGPSAPKYPADARRFLEDHAEAADILVRGEGEDVLCQLLDSMSSENWGVDPVALALVPGLTFVDPNDASIVTTADQPRIADLDRLPSPYLTGEFDHIGPEAWVVAAALESNRGCPYGCTYCDWGSATMSRIRKFDLDRVVAEFAWCAEREVAVTFADANFGILPRDVELAERVADVRANRGSSRWLSFTPAKNTTRHLTKIFDHLFDAGFVISAAISLQTIDEDILAAVDRSNISTQSYLELAADLRRRAVPLQGDLLVGMPLQTYQSYMADLQFMMDHEISQRTWSLQVLPNAPLNSPEQRRRFAVATSDRGLVIRNSTMGPADADRMRRLRNVSVVAEHLGLLRHALRYVQWDHGIPATVVMDRILTMSEADPPRYPTLAAVLTSLIDAPRMVIGWDDFFGEARSFLNEVTGQEDDPVLDDVLALQQFLVPAAGRSYPATIHLRHDYLGYYRSATRSLFQSGRADLPSVPLADWPPASFTVSGDPLEIGERGMDIRDESTDERMLGDMFGPQAVYELASPLMRVLPRTRTHAVSAGAVPFGERVHG